MGCPEVSDDHHQSTPTHWGPGCNPQPEVCCTCQLQRKKQVMVATCTVTTTPPQLTDTVSHAVKEDPSLFTMNKADIVACFYTDHWQQVQFISIRRLGNILNIVIASALGWMDDLCAALTKVDKDVICCTLRRFVFASTFLTLLRGWFFAIEALILVGQTEDHHNNYGSVTRQNKGDKKTYTVTQLDLQHWA